MTKTIFRFFLFSLFFFLSSFAFALGSMESSSKSDPKKQEAPDPRTGRPSRPPTPRPTGNAHINSAGMRFTLVQPGDLVMGDRLHETSITRPFYLGTALVTERQWTAVMGVPVAELKNRLASYSEGADGPVKGLNWNDVQEFINVLNEKEGTNRYRLPTEAEWVYAARSDLAMSGSEAEWCDGWFADRFEYRRPSGKPQL
jgi:formylglycine-generating enzyme required for sulfatase activity